VIDAVPVPDAVPDGVPDPVPDPVCDTVPEGLTVHVPDPVFVTELVTEPELEELEVQVSLGELVQVAESVAELVPD